MAKYYSMSGAAKKEFAAGCAPKTLDKYALWDLLEDLHDESQWIELVLDLDSDPPPDYLGANVVSRMCSHKMVDVLRPFTHNVLWLPVTAKRGSQIWNYYLMHFASIPDVIDTEKSVYAGERLFKPCISAEKAAAWPVFYLDQLGSLVYLESKVKDAIEQACCTNVEFEEARSA